MHMLASSHVGGAEQVCIDLARYQKTAGHNVTLLSLERGDVYKLAEKYKIEFNFADTGPTDSLVKMSRWKAETLAIKKCVSSIRPQIVHSHLPKTHLMCHRIMPELSIPWVATMHGSFRQFAYAPQTENQLWLRPYLFVRHALGDRIATRSAARIVCVADYVKHDLEKIGVSSARMVTIHNGLDWEGDMVSREAARAKFEIQPDEIAIGAIGYFAPVKGFDILIKAMSILSPRYPQLRLLIAGGNVLEYDATKQNLEELICRFGLSGKVQLFGKVDPRAGFLSMVDIFVVSSRTEGLGLVLIDAMYYGKPSVVTSTGGCSEAARPEIESLVFRSGSAGDLAEKLERLIKDSSLRQSLGQAASARASGYLRLSRCAAEYETLYKDVLGLSA